MAPAAATGPAAAPVAIITGTRAEYGIWKPVVQALVARGIQPQFIITGVHLLPQFGSTWREVRQDALCPMIRAPMYRTGATPAEALARGTASIAAALQQADARVVLLLGDRLEMLAGAAAGMASLAWLCHLHGGENAAGVFDQQIRHAITKMAHVHCAATAAAARRLVQMGEPPAQVHQTGAPALDRAVAAAKRFRAAGTGGNGSPLLVLHPDHPDSDLQERQAARVLSCLRAAGYGKVRVVGPNNDPGHEGILRAYAGAGDALLFTASATQEQFWQWLWESPFIIGNSSSGLIEAASFSRAAINLGSRQAGREASSNVVHAGFGRGEITAAIRLATGSGFSRRLRQCTNVYGDGRASGRIARVVAATLRREERHGFPPGKVFYDLPAAEVPARSGR